MISRPATNLVPEDVSSSPDLMFFEPAAGEVQLVVRPSSAVPADTANWLSHLLDMSRDGRFVLFESAASDLIPGFPAVPGGSTQLYLSEGTVRNYLSSAIAKTGTRNRVEAVLHAEQHGWL